MVDLKPCPMCGSSAEIDHSGSVEIYGWAWQITEIACKDDFHKHCRLNLSFEADFTSVPGNATPALVAAWNSLPRSEPLHQDT